MATNLFNILNKDIVIGGDKTLSMIASWDGVSKVTIYQTFSTDKLLEIDTITEESIDCIGDAYDVAKDYFDSLSVELAEIDNLTVKLTEINNK